MSGATRTTTDRCPRCGGGLHCGMNDESPCACTGIQLDAQLQQRLRERYSGCLCLPCLKALAQGAAEVERPRVPIHDGSPTQAAVDQRHRGCAQRRRRGDAGAPRG